MREITGTPQGRSDSELLPILSLSSALLAMTITGSPGLSSGLAVRLVEAVGEPYGPDRWSEPIVQEIWPFLVLQIECAEGEVVW